MKTTRLGAIIRTTSMLLFQVIFITLPSTRDLILALVPPQWTFCLRQVCLYNLGVHYVTVSPKRAAFPTVDNVHGLIHLAADVKQFGPLDSFSAFPF